MAITDYKTIKSFHVKEDVRFPLCNSGPNPVSDATFVRKREGGPGSVDGTTGYWGLPSPSPVPIHCPSDPESENFDLRSRNTPVPVRSPDTDGGLEAKEGEILPF